MVVIESIKNKNFSFIFNSLNNDGDAGNLLHELSSIPSDCFTSFEHYQFYKRFVVPKIKLVGKSYDWKSAIARYKVYRVVNKLYLIISDLYLMPVFVTDIYYKYRIDENDNYSLLNTREHVFVFGFNSDGKLFVNEIPNTYFSLPHLQEKVLHNGAVTLVLTDTQRIRTMLNFDYDVADRETIVIESTGLYRVQGEIVLRVDRELRSIEEFFTGVVNRDRIAEYVRTYIMNYVSLALIELGFSIEPDTTIVIANALPSRIVENPEKLLGILERLGNAVVDMLGRYMEINAVNYRTIEDSMSKYYAVEYDISSNVSFFHLTVSFDYREPIPFTTPYSNIRISASIDASKEYDRCLMCKEIERELIETVRSSPRQSFKFMVGNHVIELRNIYSGNIEFRPSRRLEIELVRLPTILGSLDTLNMYYADTESEIVVTHREHGVTRIRFAKPFLLNFTTTTVLADYPEKLNRIVLENIADGFYRNRKMVEYLH